MAVFATHRPMYAFYFETMAVDPSDIPGEEAFYMSSTSSDSCSEVSVKYFLQLCWK